MPTKLVCPLKFLEKSAEKEKEHFKTWSNKALSHGIKNGGKYQNNSHKEWAIVCATCNFERLEHLYELSSILKHQKNRTQTTKIDHIANFNKSSMFKHTYV